MDVAQKFLDAAKARAARSRAADVHPAPSMPGKPAQASSSKTTSGQGLLPFMQHMMNKLASMDHVDGVVGERNINIDAPSIEILACYNMNRAHKCMSVILVCGACCVFLDLL